MVIAWLGLLPRLLGMGPRKPPEPASVREMIPTSEKPLDARELAVQVSDMVVDAVMSTVGLTAENIKKLENLGEAPLLDAKGGGSQEVGVADAVFSKLTAIGLTEKNIKQLTISEGGAPSLATGEGLSQAARIPLHLDDDTDSLEIPSSSFTEDPFDSSIRRSSVLCSTVTVEVPCVCSCCSRTMVKVANLAIHTGHIPECLKTMKSTTCKGAENVGIVPRRCDCCWAVEKRSISLCM
ncbi:hypothetical protein HD554DRAFT_1832144 [Boletus coccyginus]|nr:hypothetical protein HD554DRAFT_1832144 [Boletus coccyginus]